MRIGFGQALSWAYDDDDDVEERKRKQLLVPAIMGIFVSYLVLCLAIMHTGTIPIVFWMQVGVAFLLLVHIAYTRRLSPFVTNLGTILMGFIGCILADAWSFGQYDFWMGCVLSMDCMLITRGSPLLMHALFAMYVVYIVLLTVEQGTPFLLWDLVPESLRLEDPPPPTGAKVALLRTFGRLCPFVGGFLMTQAYANGMHSESVKVKACVKTAELVSKALVRFDLDEADHLILQESNLPDLLQEALLQLVVNLRTYKPYLPQACLPDEYESETASPAPAAVSQKSRGSASSSSRSQAYSTISINTLTTSKNPIARKKVTILLTNVREFSNLYSRDYYSSLDDFHVAYLSFAIDVIREGRGLTDIFLGDRIYANFNCARPCPNHAHHAVLSSWRLLDPSHGLLTQHHPALSLNIALACGKAVLGVFGTSQLKRYSVLGTLTSRVAILERLGTREMLPILADQQVQEAVSPQFPCRLLAHAVFPLQRGPYLQRLYAVYPSSSLPHDIPDWMLACGDTVTTEWKTVNDVIELIYEGHFVDAKRLAQAEIHRLGTQASPVPEQVARLEALQSLVATYQLQNTQPVPLDLAKGSTLPFEHLHQDHPARRLSAPPHPSPATSALSSK